MDLSNLSTDLPPTKPIDETSINELNRELTTEFKNAAKSVASLYNSSILTGNKDMKHQKMEFANAAKSGYLECLDDLLNNISNGEDIENWALTKRAEIINMNKNNLITSSTTEPISNEVTSNNEIASTESDAFNIPTDYDFALSQDFSTSYRFRPSFPALSVTHGHKFRNNLKKNKKNDSFKKKYRLQNERNCSLEESTGLSDYETDRDSEDLNTKKNLDGGIAKKKRKLLSGNLMKTEYISEDKEHHDDEIN
ncbi:hypothetical protein QCA50_015932 [Cerrena zonata]|uniref:Uncharacterized protein n=1 Tax=Cerrena zonata TaxID=2478898 RepID=A0AAW0FPX1_9APHY